MGHGHDHAEGAAPPASPPVRRILGLALAPLLFLTVVGLAVLWPTGEDRTITSPDVVDTGTLEHASVTRLVVEPCFSGSDPSGPGGQTSFDQSGCMTIEAVVTTGPDDGTTIVLPRMVLGGIAPDLRVGDVIVVSRVVVPGVDGPIYNYADLDRQTPMALLLALFVVAVVGIGRLRGLAALVGLAITLVLLVAFTLPSILEGHDPILVALVTGSAAMILILYLTHGFHARTATALLGTLVSLLLTALLAWWFVAATRVTGQSEDEVVTLALAGSRVSITGLLLAGIIIGALGVLNDVTVTQASAVWQLHQVNPSLSGRELYGRAMSIGRDHIASVVDTLVLAYAGAALPLLVLFAVAPKPFGTIVNGEIVAVEIVRTLVGSIGLVLSVPITTGLAAAVVARSRADRTALANGGDGREGRVEAAREATATTAARRRLTDAAEKRRRKRELAQHERKESWRPPRSERDFWEPG